MFVSERLFLLALCRFSPNEFFAEANGDDSLNLGHIVFLLCL